VLDSANVRYWPILLKNSLLKPLLLSRFCQCDLPDPALPDLLFSSGGSVRSFRYFRLSYGHFPVSRRTCP
jgi:hypothetical protein